MFDPSSITIGQISSSVRDFAVAGTVITVSWKARGAYEKVVAFFDRTIKHMDVMEGGMQTLLSNHLAHIEQYVKTMSNHQARVLNGEEVIHVVDEEASGK